MRQLANRFPLRNLTAIEFCNNRNVAECQTARSVTPARPHSLLFLTFVMFFAFFSLDFLMRGVVGILNAVCYYLLIAETETLTHASRRRDEGSGRVDGCNGSDDSFILTSNAKELNHTISGKGKKVTLM